MQHPLRVAYTLGLTLAAFLLRLYLNREFGFHLSTFLTLYPAVVLSAILFGFWPGVLATLLGSLLTWVWVFEPVGTLQIASLSDPVSLAIFVITCIALSYLTKRYRDRLGRIEVLEHEHDLHAARARLSSAMASMSEAFLITDTQGNFLDFNEAFTTFHRFPSENDRPRSVAEYAAIIEVLTRDGEPVPPEMWTVQRALRGEVGTNVERKLRRKDTGESWIGSYNFSPIRDQNGAVTGAVVTARDVTRQRQAELALQASETRYRTAFQTSIDAIAINSLEDGAFLDVNLAFVGMTGWERQEALGCGSLDLKLWVDIEQRKLLLDLLRVGASARDLRTQLRKKDGRLLPVLLTASLMEIDGRPCSLTIIRDVSAVKAAEQELWNLAYVDLLTGLPNRRHLLERLRVSIDERMLSQNKRALLVIDLDNFKNVNDTLGHRFGDLLLREVSYRLTASVRKADTVSRLGGDEFVVLLDDLSEDQGQAVAEATAIAEKILAKVNRTFVLDGRPCESSCSIGITVFAGNQDDSSQVLRQADIAMHQAKAAGRNALCFFSPSQQAAVNSRHALEVDLRNGLKNHEFVLYYQPQVADGRWIGAEALVRWNHPQRGLLFPGEFIAMAEETKLVLPLGDWVLEAACRQLVAWASREPEAGLSIAVNISAVQLRQTDFAAHVLGIVERTGANPHRLELELTESSLLKSTEDAIVKMAALKQAGVKTSIDDFGTGYSSLSYLRRLPLNRLKIDRTFVRDILVDSGSSAIAQAIISLGRAMGLSVIAEGVETTEQMRCLAGIGCYAYQGFLFSQAVPVEEFEHLLRANRAQYPPAPRAGIENGRQGTSE